MELNTCYEVLKKVEERSTPLPTKQLEQATVWIRSQQEFQALLTSEQWNEFLDAQAASNFKYSVVAQFCNLLFPVVRSAWMRGNLALSKVERESPLPPKV